jgi:histidine ammonia-lyase
MKPVHYISSEPLSLSEVSTLLTQAFTLELSTEAKKRIEDNYSYLHRKIEQHKDPIYGINTGFGSLCDTAVDPEHLAQLQTNLVRSHACGIGEEVPSEVVKIMLLLKIQSLSYGYSGIALSTVERLVDFYNYGITPVVYQQGSLGASGDLAPLAHISLGLIGEGEVYFNNEKISAKDVHSELGWTPISLQAKEGLALLNGTQFMSAYGVYNVIKASKLSYWADLIAALSIEAFNCNQQFLDPLVHFIRPHQGQILTAERIREFLEGSNLAVQPDKKVQDPYSFRCIPQVHGATKDTLNFVAQTMTKEINSVTDNPNVFDQEDLVISAGNFHGQPLALALDYLGIATAELANISERRTYQLISGQRNLPHFLVAQPGLNSGLMIAQYTAASIVSQNKQWATPASVDSIVSSNGQEDHVSMGANAATKCYKILDNVASVLAIELLTAAQAMEFRKDRTLNEFLSQVLLALREVVPPLLTDRIIHNDIMAVLRFMDSFNIDAELLEI